jgi:hypothetical protein
MVYVFVVLVGALGVVIYLTVVFRAVPGAIDERLGKLEELPSNLGEWSTDRDSETAKQAAAEGLVRETRILLESGKGLLGGEKIVEQARYRDGPGGRIVRVEPERRWNRRRTKA